MIERREVLHLLLATGGSALLGPTAEAMSEAGERAAADDGGKERVLGIGGVFFKAKDPDALGRWYEEHLGIALTPTRVDSPEWHTEAGVTIFSPFPESTTYFGDAKQMWMLNFRVRDIGKMTAQLKAAGIAVALDPQAYPNGRFARLHDPEGNPIELWQPMERGVVR